MSVDHWYMEQFRDLDRRPDRTKLPLKRIAILSTPRSGSTFFCESLARTERFGQPDEWLNPRRIEAYGRHRGLQTVAFKEYLEFILRKTPSDNGVFSIKLHIDQYQTWKQKNFDAFDLRFDEIVHFYRRDKAAQAHSYAKAMKTDQWRSYFEAKPAAANEPVARSAIARALLSIIAWEEFYEINLSRRVGRTYCYEDIVGDDDFVRRALDDCGIDSAGPLNGKPSIVVQRNLDDLREIEAFKRYISGLAG